MEALLLRKWWVGVVLWTLLGISDYYLTIWGARLYQQRAKSFTEVEGSYESIPMLQVDINTFRSLSPRFLAILTLGALFIGLLARFRDAWEIGDRDFLFVVGALLMVQVPIHLRHIGNIARFQLMTVDSGIEGKIKYPRWFVLRVSAVDFLAFSFFLLICFAGTTSWFVFGGCIRCFAFSAYFYWKSQKVDSRATQQR